MNHKVECTNCNFRGVVDKVADVCPKCNHGGTLVWQDGERQEVDSPITVVHACNNIERVEAVNAELLAALEEFLAWSTSDGESMRDGLEDEARAAISKAKEAML